LRPSFNQYTPTANATSFCLEGGTYPARGLSPASVRVAILIDMGSRRPIAPVLMCLPFVLLAVMIWLPRAVGVPASAIRFELKPIPFQLEHGEVAARHVPATMAGGVAVFDYNRDGRPDIFFTNGANLATLKKDDPKYRNRLFRNDGNGVFTDVTETAGLAGSGFDSGVAVGDYDNDGYPDLFVAGVHHNTLYHNNGNGTFTDVTEKAGISNRPDPQFGPMWAITAVWVDVNNDGLLDLFVVNYLQWDYATEPVCGYKGVADYCARAPTRACRTSCT
jgi:enediyne biosynthesis protein E4